MNHKSDETSIQALAVLGEADETLLLAVAGGLPVGEEVVVENGRFLLSPDTATPNFAPTAAG